MALLLFSAAVIAALSLSCKSDIVYHGYGSTHEYGWYRGDTVRLHIPRLQQSGNYIEEIEFRTSTRYPFTSLRLVVDKTVIHHENGKTTNHWLSDTITCRVADEEGRPLGEGLDFYQYSIPFKQQQLADGDSLYVRITHGMQRTAIQGIVDVGYRLTLR
jgi:gliding motility-associated lipoprotein GldH